MPKTRRILVTGRVQGVFFRASTLSKARELGVHGWVRNLPGGQVEIHAEGPKASMQDLLDWCHEGPPAALVTNVSHDDAEFRGLGDFRILPTPNH